MNFFREFLIGLSFYTRLPIQLQNVTEDEFYNSMLLMPVIGVVIGAALWGFGWCVSWIGIPELAAILMLIFYIWLTGGLHYDGVADTIDAVFSARDHEKMMTIMKDSRLGHRRQRLVHALHRDIRAAGYGTLSESCSEGQMGPVGLIHKQRDPMAV